jgi:hypothetical protein
MSFKKLTAAEVTFTVVAEQEDIPVRGNAMSSDDPEADRHCEDEIIAELNRGNTWAWCCVVVTATWGNWSASDTLGACSYFYDGADEFKRGGYYQDMCANALENLNADLARAYETRAARVEVAS